MTLASGNHKLASTFLINMECLQDSFSTQITKDIKTNASSLSNFFI